jgi:dipeptidase E
VRLLLTSGGVTNTSILDALADLLDKPIADSGALCIPTAAGLADLLPSLQDTVWVGVSARSMVMTPRIGDDFVNWTPPAGGDSTLGVVDFSIFPHAGDMPGNTMAAAERWAAEIAGPAYAMDDQTAIKVSDGTVEVISEGHWKLFPA